MLNATPIPLSPRAKQHYERVFKPKYLALEQAVRQVPLVILLWGPGSSSKELYDARLALRDELKQNGHAVFLGEDLKSTQTASTSMQGVDILPSHDVDLIVAIQPTYGVIANEQSFIDHYVVDAKMLVFVDQSARDAYAYRNAIAELKTLYDNVETYRLLEDITQRGLMSRVLDKIERLQMVKYRALTGAENWGLLTNLEESF
jgi:hypothetical protein